MLSTRLDIISAVVVEAVVVVEVVVLELAAAVSAAVVTAAVVSVLMLISDISLITVLAITNPGPHIILF